jgi:hypothetical protein
VFNSEHTTAGEYHAENHFCSHRCLWIASTDNRCSGSSHIWCDDLTGQFSRLGAAVGQKPLYLAQDSAMVRCCFVDTQPTVGGAVQFL